MITDYDTGGGEDYFENIDFTEMDEDELAALAPRRRYLIELERMLDVELPATTKTHVGDNWKKSSPNITNDDLKQILIGIARETGQSFQVAKELRRDLLPLTPQEQRIYKQLDESGDEMKTAYELGDALGLEPSTIQSHLGNMRSKMDLRTEREGHRVKYGLPPGYRGLDFEGIQTRLGE